MMDWYSHTKASVAHYDIPTELKNGLDQDLDLGLEWELQICLSVAEETETDTERETEGISGCCNIVRCLCVCLDSLLITTISFYFQIRQSSYI